MPDNGPCNRTVKSGTLAPTSTMHQQHCTTDNYFFQLQLTRNFREEILVSFSFPHLTGFCFVSFRRFSSSTGHFYPKKSVGQRPATPRAFPVAPRPNTSTPVSPKFSFLFPICRSFFLPSSLSLHHFCFVSVFFFLFFFFVEIYF